jgi:serine/threonine-protein kinase RsbW
MVWVGSFKSLESALCSPRVANHPLEVHTWIPTSIGLISPLVDWLMSLIAGSRCVEGSEDSVALAVREALSNAMLHGNSLNAGKLVHVRCCCEFETGVFIVVRDQGLGFDTSRVPNPLANENLSAVHGRGIYFMRLLMDEVSFERKGTEVHLSKGHEGKQSRSGHRAHPVRPQWLVRPSLRGSCCRIARVQRVSQPRIPNEDGLHETGVVPLGETSSCR